MRCRPCTWPSIRRSRPRAFPFVSPSSMRIPSWGIGPLRAAPVKAWGRRLPGSVEERPLRRHVGTLSGAGRLRPRLALDLLDRRRLGIDIARGARELPALLVRDPVALLDHEQVHEPGKGVLEQREVLLPVP